METGAGSDDDLLAALADLLPGSWTTGGGTVMAAGAADVPTRRRR
ncbi:MAG: hypothetical protein WKF82_06075 [Nocardioidaceae bacterium]